MMVVKIENENIDAPRIRSLVDFGLVLILCLISLAVGLAYV